MSVWNRKLTQAEYRKETAIIKKIMALGFTEQDILSAWNYYTGKGQKITSFAFFLWKKGKLITDILHFVRMTKAEVEKVKVDSNEDFRAQKKAKKKLTKRDFLNNTGELFNEDEGLDKK